MILLLAGYVNVALGLYCYAIKLGTVLLTCRVTTQFSQNIETMYILM